MNKEREVNTSTVRNETLLKNEKRINRGGKWGFGYNYGDVHYLQSESIQTIFDSTIQLEHTRKP